MTGFETQVINELAVLKLYRAVSKTPHLNVIPSLGRPQRNSQVQRAARLIAAGCGFAMQVESGALTPDVFKGKIPVDMRQYKSMFASTRIPSHTH